MGNGMEKGVGTGTGMGMGMGMGLRIGNGEPACRQKQVASSVDIAGCLVSAYRGIESAVIFLSTDMVLSENMN
jgi:hypothetical protein